jgi:1-acyl-sn-glycerol-3-phosphate acyltransferase
MTKKYRVINKELLPREDGLIMVYNHRDYWDIPLVFSILGTRPIHALVKVELKTEPVGKLLGFMGAVFVDRDNPENRKNAKGNLLELALNGRNILISPEGTRNKTNETLLYFRGHGAVSIAQKTGRPIVPFAISKYGENGKQKLIRICNPFYVGAEDDLGVANERLYKCVFNALMENEKSIERGI